MTVWFCVCLLGITLLLLISAISVIKSALSIRKKEDEIVDDLMGKLSVKAPNAEVPVNNLSGGQTSRK